MSFLPILNNIALLVSLSVAYMLIVRNFDSRSQRIQLLSGFVFGLFTLIGMHNSVVYEQGVIFDGRSIILSVAGLFGGPVTAAIAAVMAAGYRIHLGGSGMIMGISVILQSAIVGVLFHYLLKKFRRTNRYLLYGAMGFLVHVVMLVLFITLPSSVRSNIFGLLFFPVLIVYPLASFVICLVFDHNEKYHELVQHLSASEERFRQLFYGSKVPFLVIDPQKGEIVDANMDACQFYGYSLDQLKQMHIGEINTLEEEQLYERMNRVISGRQFKFQFQHKLASGELKDVEVFTGPVEVGGKVLLYSIIHDVTLRKQMERQLRESVISYRGLFDSVSDAIYIQNRLGVFLDVNLGVEKMFGYPRKDFIGKDPSFLNAEGLNDLGLIQTFIEKAFEGEKVVFQYWGQRKNGEIFPEQVRLFKGKYFGEEVIIAFGQDISEQVAAQKEIEESRADLNALLNVSEDIIIMLDKRARIITYNNAFGRMLGRKRDYRGEVVFELLPEALARTRIRYFQSVLEMRQITSFEEQKDGRNWWITFYPILDRKAEVERIAVFERDITAQVKSMDLEKNLELAEKSARMKQQFLANMSHEMRTPMNGIVGMTKMLAKTQLNEDQEDYLNTIQESADSLLALINDILDLSRFESGKMPLIMGQVSLKTLEKRIYNLFALGAREKGLDFRIEFSPDMPWFMIADEKRLMQVLINLLGNALKFTPEGSVVLKGEKLRTMHGKHFLKFAVSDTGIGIDPEFLNYIFDEFAQYDNSRTRKYEGTGLGLAISKKIAELMGGDITVVSRKGKGSTFSFTFWAEEPSSVADASATEEKSEESVPFQPLGMKVLLVEDKMVNRKVASLILESMGCQVDMAENGKIGVEKVLSHTYDVVLMDIQMPVMDGLSAVRALRASGKKIPPIIGLSAEAMEGDAEKYIAEGMNDYITKPLIPELLYQKLSQTKNSYSRAD